MRAWHAHACMKIICSSTVSEGWKWLFCFQGPRGKVWVCCVCRQERAQHHGDACQTNGSYTHSTSTQWLWQWQWERDGGGATQWVCLPVLIGAAKLPSHQVVICLKPVLIQLCFLEWRIQKHSQERDCFSPTETIHKEKQSLSWGCLCVRIELCFLE